MSSHNCAILLLLCFGFKKIKEKKYKRNINNDLAIVASQIPGGAIHDIWTEDEP